jgi:ubiquinone biosynthesis protein UbiJ
MIIDLLEMASNNALQYDEKALQALAKLQGKSIVLEVRPLGDLGVQRIAIMPQPHGLEYSMSPIDNPDVTLAATLGAMVKITRDGLDDAELEPGELEINGDPIVGQRFAKLLAELDVDWEGLLAEHLGDTPAVAISSGFEHVKAFASQSQSQIKHHLNKLLLEDLKLVASEATVNQFMDDVDTIRADTDRLQARIKRLQARFAS